MDPVHHAVMPLTACIECRKFILGRLGLHDWNTQPQCDSCDGWLHRGQCTQNHSHHCPAKSPGVPPLSPAVAHPQEGGRSHWLR